MQLCAGYNCPCVLEARHAACLPACLVVRSLARSIDSTLDLPPSRSAGSIAARLLVACLLACCYSFDRRERRKIFGCILRNQQKSLVRLFVCPPSSPTPTPSRNQLSSQSVSQSAHVVVVRFDEEAWLEFDGCAVDRRPRRLFFLFLSVLLSTFDRTWLDRWIDR